ncbi:MAG: hypothetical protein H6658_05490 [Ardenticatenaceae bacterium]|nr:hypothetical protein [Ardenticatenaceae bacterium]
MADKRRSPTDTRDQAIQIREAWTALDATRSYGSYDLADLQTALANLDSAEANVANLEAQLTQARNARIEERHTLWEIVKRVRAGAKADHGDDSSEYEMFGGTRMSEKG